MFLTSMVSCLFARGVYKLDMLAECLGVMGFGSIADSMPVISETIQQKRWQIRLDEGFNPNKVSIPKRFLEVAIWKGQTDPEYLEELKKRLRTTY